MEPNKQNNFQKRINEIIKLARIAVEGETEYFFQNLAILLISGIDIKVVLKSLKEELRSRSMKEITEFIKESFVHPKDDDIKDILSLVLDVHDENLSITDFDKGTLATHTEENEHSIYSFSIPNQGVPRAKIK